MALSRSLAAYRHIHEVFRQAEQAGKVLRCTFPDRRAATTFRAQAYWYRKLVREEHKLPTPWDAFRLLIDPAEPNVVMIESAPAIKVEVVDRPLEVLPDLVLVATKAGEEQLLKANLSPLAKTFERLSLAGLSDQDIAENASRNHSAEEISRAFAELGKLMPGDNLVE